MIFFLLALRIKSKRNLGLEITKCPSPDFQLIQYTFQNRFKNDCNISIDNPPWL